MYECYICGIDRGGSGMREDGNCIQCGALSKKKLKARVESLIADIDNLSAENIELQKDRDNWQRQCKNLVEAMAHHGYSPESLARIAEGL